jgi:hypothetical protein
MKATSSSADITSRIAKAEREAKEDQPTFTQPILKFAAYTATLEYRGAVGPAPVHETEAEMFYVIESSGTPVLGGKLATKSDRTPTIFTGTANQPGLPPGRPSTGYSPITGTSEFHALSRRPG